MRELISRVRANLRRVRAPAAAAPADEVLVGGPTRMDVARHEVIVRAQPVALPAEGIRAARGLPAAQGAPADQRLPDRGGMGRRLLRGYPDARRPRETPAPQVGGGPPPPRPPPHGAGPRLQVRRLTRGCRPPVAGVCILRIPEGRRGGRGCPGGGSTWFRATRASSSTSSARRATSRKPRRRLGPDLRVRRRPREGPPHPGARARR